MDFSTCYYVFLAFERSAPNRWTKKCSVIQHGDSTDSSMCFLTNLRCHYVPLMHLHILLLSMRFCLKKLVSYYSGGFSKVAGEKKSRPLLEESCAGSTASATQARAAAPAQRAHEAAARASCAILHHQPLSSRRLLLVILCARQKAAAPFCM